MHEFVETNLFDLIGLSLLFFLIGIKCFNKIIVNIGDPLLHLIIQGSISVATLILLTPYGQDSSKAKIFFLISYIIIVVVALVFIDKKTSINFLINSDFVNIKQINSIFILAIITGIIIMLNFIDSGSNYQDRGNLFVNFRITENLRVSSTAFLAFSLGFISNKKFMFLYLTPIVLVNIFTGSKGYFISIFLNFILGYGLSNRYSFSYNKLLIIILVCYLSVYLLLTIQNIDNINMAILYRLLASGDIYFHGLQELDIKRMDGIYNIFEYIVHPLTSLFGYRMYEVVLGIKIQTELSGGEYISGGTNAGFLYLCFISFLNKCYLFIFTLAWVTILLKTRLFLKKYLLYIKTKNKKSLLDLLIIYILFTIPVIFFLDVGVGIQQLFGCILIYIYLYLFTKLYEIKI